MFVLSNRIILYRWSWYGDIGMESQFGKLRRSAYQRGIGMITPHCVFKGLIVVFFFRKCK